MLYYDRTDLVEGIYPTKSNKGREHMIYHYFFFNHGFKFENYVRNDCRNLTMLSVNIGDIVLNFGLLKTISFYFLV